MSIRSRHLMLPSSGMGRSVHVWCFGHYGHPVVVFPSAAGFAHEWQAQGMVEALEPMIQAGRIKLYCPESNVAEAWTRSEGEPTWRIGRHLAYEQFILDTLVPFVREDCHQPNGRMAVAGCSLGAMYAANFALKYPSIFHYALCMSGRYEARHFMNGFDNSDVYLNNPLAYIPNMHGNHLQEVRANTHLSLVCGQGRWEEGCIDETRALGAWLERKGIPSWTDIWGRDVSHQWPWWKRQVVYHFRQTFN